MIEYIMQIMLCMKYFVWKKTKNQAELEHQFIRQQNEYVFDKDIFNDKIDKKYEFEKVGNKLFDGKIIVPNDFEVIEIQD